MTGRGHLERLHEAIEGDFEELMDRFYARLEADPIPATTLPLPPRRTRLMGSMKHQIEDLLTRTRDEDWRRRRLALAPGHLQAAVPASVTVRSFGPFAQCPLEMLDEPATRTD